MFQKISFSKSDINTKNKNIFSILCYTNYLYKILKSGINDFYDLIVYYVDSVCPFCIINDKNK